MGDGLRLYLFFLITSLIPYYGLASTPDGETAPIELETVQVSANSNQSSDIHQIYLSSQDYAYSSLSGVLDKVSGLQTQGTGGFGTYSSFWLRGSSAKSVAVYLDGIEINDPLNGGINLATLPLWSLQSIEIYKSTVPVHLANASGTGAMNFKTLEVKQQKELQLSTGSFSSRSIAGNLGSNDYLVSSEWFNAKNDYSYQHDNQTQFNKDDDYPTTRKNNQVDRKFLLVKANKELNKFEVNTMAIHRRNRAGISNSLNQSQHAYFKQDSTLLSASVKKSSWQVIASSDFANHLYDDSKDEIGLSADTQSIQFNQHQLKLLNTIKIKGMDLDISLQGRQENVQIEDIKDEIEKKSNITTDYLSIAQSLMLNKNISLSSSWSKRDGSGQRYDSANASVLYTYLKTNWANLHLSLAKKTRLPSISELFISQGNQVGNPDLKPENFYEFNSRSEFIFYNYGALIELYFRESQDTIIFSYNAQGVGRASNDGSSQILGLEGQTYWNIGMLELNWNFELIDSINNSDIKSNKDKKLPSFFNASNYISVSYWMNDLRLQIENQYKSGLYYDSANLEKAPNQNTWSLSADYHQNIWSLGINIHNIFDNFYTGFKTEPLPGRSAIINFTLNH